VNGSGQKSIISSGRTGRGIPSTATGIELPHRSVSGVAGVLKRTVDVVVAAAALIVLSPVLAAIIASIRVFNGYPAFYQQTRIGRGGREFTIFKLRTMPVGAEDGIGPVWSVRNDPRPTRLGALLRRTGFDELPQLVNVLKGEMSLVGPRPERPSFVQVFRQNHRDYDQRHAVRPGLTGYAQVHGWRGSTDLGERTKHDLYYVRAYSLGLDFYILALTLVRGWSERTTNGVAR